MARIGGSDQFSITLPTLQKIKEEVESSRLLFVVC
jgi:hypothetical protein